MSDLKTKPNRKSVKRFIAAVENDRRREDAEKLLALMEDITGEKPVMWGDSIVGFGKYAYKYDSGREGEWLLTGFSPRKASLSVYIMSGFGKMESRLKKLGKHKHSVSCLYINRLDDVDLKVLARIIRESIKIVRKRDGGGCG